MKKLTQHKSFIYHGDSLQYNRKHILDDLSELLEVPCTEIFTSEDVWEFDCKDLGVDDWEEVYNHFLYHPTGQYKVILFENADNLSARLQNKLLKPIEDSEDFIKVIFNTTKALLGTIHSRSTTLKLVSDTSSAFPKSTDDLLNYFGIDDNSPVIVEKAVTGIAKAIKESSSLLFGSGLIKEKSKALKFLSTKVQEIARLILLYEIESQSVTSRSFVASRYLEVESNESNLYLLMLELEI